MNRFYADSAARGLCAPSCNSLGWLACLREDNLLGPDLFGWAGCFGEGFFDLCLFFPRCCVTAGGSSLQQAPPRSQAIRSPLAHRRNASRLCRCLASRTRFDAYLVWPVKSSIIAPAFHMRYLTIVQVNIAHSRTIANEMTIWHTVAYSLCGPHLLNHPRLSIRQANRQAGWLAGRQAGKKLDRLADCSFRISHTLAVYPASSSVLFAFMLHQDSPPCDRSTAREILPSCMQKMKTAYHHPTPLMLSSCLAGWLVTCRTVRPLVNQPHSHLPEKSTLHQSSCAINAYHPSSSTYCRVVSSF